MANGSTGAPDKRLSFRIGLLVSKHWVPAAILGAGGLIWFNMATPTPPEKSVLVAVPSTPRPDPRIDACGPGLDQKIQQAKSSATKKDFQEAFATLDYCADLLAKDSPAYKARISYKLEVDKQVYARAMADQKAAKAIKKREGVSIGMSQQDVLDSSWGKPTKVNRTTTSNTTREQWIYGNGYLYFTDGVLDTVQN